MSLTIVSSQFRCDGETAKTYNGERKLKTCNALLAESNKSGTMAFTIKCWRCGKINII
jgi:hypothetical protein